MTWSNVVQLSGKKVGYYVAPMGTRMGTERTGVMIWCHVMSENRWE